MPCIRIGACLVLGACSVEPVWQQIADRSQLGVDWVTTPSFRHLAISNAVSGGHLRIYIEGDGTPWIRETRVAIDPTPDNPLALRLMSLDEGPAVYLGRPCYFGTATSKPCKPALWTGDRYGRSVIRSMCVAANRLSSQQRAMSVELVGYSGGAAIALRMPECTERLVRITTIAGNLDVAAWTAWHGYTPLAAHRFDDAPAAAAHRVTESHWQCRDDRQIPPAITNAYFEAHPDAERHLVEGCSHASGWEQYRKRIFPKRI